MCGSALCQNNQGSYDCLCEDGYIYDNASRSCVGEYMWPFAIKRIWAAFFDLLPQQASDEDPLDVRHEKKMFWRNSAQVGKSLLYFFFFRVFRPKQLNTCKLAKVPRCF